MRFQDKQKVYILPPPIYSMADKNPLIDDKPNTKTLVPETSVVENKPSTPELPQANSLIEQGLKVAKELREENDRRERLLKEEKDLMNLRILGGGSLAGSQPAQPISREQKLKQEAIDFWGKDSDIGKALAKS